MTTPLEDRLASDLLYAMKYGNDDNLMTSAKESLAAYESAKTALSYAIKAALGEVIAAETMKHTNP